MPKCEIVQPSAGSSMSCSVAGVFLTQLTEPETVKLIGFRIKSCVLVDGYCRNPYTTTLWNDSAVSKTEVLSSDAHETNYQIELVSLIKR